MTERFRTVLYLALGWVLLQIASWLLNSWLDTYVTQTNVSVALQVVARALVYLGGSFGLGFVIGALLFSIWDWPLIGQWIRKQREKLRNKEADEELAQQCDEISKYLYEQAAALERIRNDSFWAQSGAQSSEDRQKSWRDARAAEAREEEGIRRQIGPKVQAALIALKDRGIKMDLWGLSLSTHDLPTASFSFADLANSLRNGTYLERHFSASRTDLPARM